MDEEAPLALRAWRIVARNGKSHRAVGHRLVVTSAGVLVVVRDGAPAFAWQREAWSVVELEQAHVSDRGEQ